MKIMVASDIHGSARFCREMLTAADAESPDRLLLLGDLLYHGPRNPLPEEYDPQQVAAMLNARSSEIMCVRGNCDAEVDQMMLEFPIMADYCILALAGRVLYATHGHTYTKASPPPLQEGDILLHGHTHIPAGETFGRNNVYLNPGSVSLPKADSVRGYLVIDGARVVWKGLSGNAYRTAELHADGMFLEEGN